MAYRLARISVWDDEAHLRVTGYLDTLLSLRPESPHRGPMPWMNFPVIDLLDERLTKDLQLFEYGSGYSTQYYAKRVCQVVSVEHDRDWYEMTQARVPQNAELKLETDVDGGTYAKVIAMQAQLFDVVIIDGVDRLNCAKESMAKLTDRGVIVLDDTHRSRETKISDHIQKQGFRCLRLRGLKPGDGKTFATSILYRDDNCLGL